MADKDLSLRISTSADVSGLDQTVKKLDGVAKASEKTGEALDAAAGSAKKAAPEMDGAGGGAGDAAEALDRATTGATGFRKSLDQTGQSAADATKRLRQVDEAAKDVSASAGGAADAVGELNESQDAAARGKAEPELEAVFERMRERAESSTNASRQAAREAGEVAEEVRRLTVLQRAEMLSQIADAGKQLGNDLTDAHRALTDSNADALESFTVLAQAGVAAAGEIAGAFAAFGPAGGATVAVVAGLQAIVNAEKAALEAAEKQREIIGRATAAATAAGEAMRRALDMTAAQEEHLTRVNAITEAYSKQAAEIDRITDAQNRRERAALAEGDAKAALELAEIERARGRGEISPEEAEERSHGVRAAAERRRFETERAAAEREIKKAERGAAAAEQSAGGFGAEAGAVRSRAANLLTAEERRRMKAELEEAARVAEETKAGVERDEDLRARYLSADPTVSPDEVRTPENIAIKKRILKEREEEVREKRRLLELDGDAQRTSGFESRDDLEAEAKRLEELREKALREAEAKRAEAELLGAESASRAKVFDLDDRRGDVESGARVEGIRRAEAEKRKQEEEKKAREEERRMERRREAGAGFMEDVRGVEGVKPAFVATMEKALSKRISGDASAAREFERLGALLIRRMEEENFKTEELRRSVRELESRLKNVNNGR